MKRKVYVQAKENCRDCHGSGETYDWVPVPFGNGNCQMPVSCGCWEDDVPEDYDERFDELIVLAAWEEIPE